MSTAPTLADDLRRVADNLDRAASISAQYCCSKHHTDIIRHAATRLEMLERVSREAKAIVRYFDRDEPDDDEDDHMLTQLVFELSDALDPKGTTS